MKYLFERLLGGMNNRQLDAICIGMLIGSFFTPNPYSVVCFIACFVVCIYRMK